MCNSLTSEVLSDKFLNFASTMQVNAAYLTQLDEAIGDANHGSNMTHGFQKVSERVQTMLPGTANLLLRSAGMVLTTTVSGASGPLYGAAFIAAGMEVRAKPDLSLLDLARMVQAAEEALVRRGRCRLGDKTIFDALHPASQALTKAAGNNLSLVEGLEAATAAARAGMEATIPLVARRGLAMQYGVASSGYQDPGATSCYLLFESLWQTVRQHCR